MIFLLLPLPRQNPRSAEMEEAALEDLRGRGNPIRCRTHFIPGELAEDRAGVWLTEISRSHPALGHCGLLQGFPQSILQISNDLSLMRKLG